MHSEDLQPLCKQDQMFLQELIKENNETLDLATFLFDKIKIFKQIVRILRQFNTIKYITIGLNWKIIKQVVEQIYTWKSLKGVNMCIYKHDMVYSDLVNSCPHQNDLCLLNGLQMLSITNIDVDMNYNNLTLKLFFNVPSLKQLNFCKALINLERIMFQTCDYYNLEHKSTQIYKISLLNCSFDINILSVILKSLTNLKQLSITRCLIFFSQINYHTFISTLPSLSKLQTQSQNDYFNIKECLQKTISEHQLQLKVLRLNCCQIQIVEQFKNMIKCLNKLQELHLFPQQKFNFRMNCIPNILNLNLTKQMVKSISISKSLKYLNLNVNLTFVVLYQIGKSLPFLQLLHLKIFRQKQCKSEAAQLMLRNLKQLRQLKINAIYNPVVDIKILNCCHNLNILQTQTFSFSKQQRNLKMIRETRKIK